MPSRRQSRPVVTFFAFQDVIMSVSGIIIIVVLLLTLELVQRPAQRERVDNSAVVRQIREALAAAQSEQQALESLLQRSDQVIRNAAAASPDEVRRAIVSLKDESDLLRERIQNIRAQLEALENAEREVQVESFDLRPTREALTAARLEAESLQRQIEVERQEDRPLFSLPHGFNRDGWLVVISAVDIAVAPVGRPAAPTTFTGTSAGLFSVRSAVSQFLEWAKTVKSPNPYFLFLIRPDGVRAFDQLRESLDNRGVSYGYDLIASDQMVLHPERGAFE